MFDLKTESDAFRLQYEKFMIACEAQEKELHWDRAALGEMQAYYFNDFMCVILHLISSDGTFAEEEADFINEAFGFRYSAEELAELYRTEKDNIQGLVTEDLDDGYRKMRDLNEELASYYRELLLKACEIVSASDGVIHRVEQKRIGDLKERLA